MSTRKRTYKSVQKQNVNSVRACEAEGCLEYGEYRAPKSREQLNAYQWFCLEHVREYNKKWNYFADMDTEEIEHFMKEAVTGHRPTWQREDHLRGKYERYAHLLQDEIYKFLYGKSRPAPKTAKLSHKERKALTAMELDAPCSLKDLKTRYRMLVKQYHPDLHQGNKLYEERFKKITQAYAYLSEHYKEKASA